MIKIIKIVIIISASFILVFLFSKSIFLANTPRINPQFVASIRNLPVNIASAINQIGFSKISQGVYAKEDKKTNVIYMRVTGDVEFEEKQLTVNGQTVILRFPKK